MDGTEVCILEEPGEVGFCGFLESDQTLCLEPQLGVDSVADGPNEPLEWSALKEEPGVLLVFSDLSESHSARAESPWWLLWAPFV